MNTKPTADSAAALLLDAQALARLRELDPDGSLGVVERVMRTYEASLLQLLPRAAAARDRGDVAAVAMIAHTLRSSSASVGALALSGRCGDLERAIRVGEAVDLQLQVEQLLAEGGRALQAVRAMLPS